ncbi:SDR family NAD(P)-dependent oxidoreductase [Pseudolabrys taiwanensis]|uniref:SDR family NAD(P)-dependent oxidoreductase n=1 Tax=Pseudolabrys taiwanensis TaxID=331696 RepID=A0A345ZSW3_9HYPH|nr:SDR family oxidoreductase [Pseudolabrys taiwanensis]AXK80010.1 SDR family NAD(P)-dependent oxidoreductase [Pseudolabrys taiwanensis]
MKRPVVLIVGGSRGIGAATARMAARAGYDVAVSFKSDGNAAAAVVNEAIAAGGRAVAIKANAVTESEIERMFDDAAAALGAIGHVVHSAGIVGKNARLDRASAETIREVIDVNLFGGLLCARAAARRMSRASGGEGGAIVLLSSVAAVTGAPNEYVCYAAAKAGIEAATRGLARELAKEGVRVNCLRPGTTDTDIHEPGRLARVTPLLPMGRPGQPDEIAAGILFLLSPAASYVNGAVLSVSGGI